MIVVSIKHIQCSAPITPGHAPTTSMKTPLRSKCFYLGRNQNGKIDNIHVPTTTSLGPHHALTAFITSLRGSYYVYNHVCTSSFPILLRPHFVLEVATSSRLRAHHASTVYLFQSKD